VSIKARTPISVLLKEPDTLSLAKLMSFIKQYLRQQKLDASAPIWIRVLDPPAPSPSSHPLGSSFCVRTGRECSDRWDAVPLWRRFAYSGVIYRLAFQNAAKPIWRMMSLLFAPPISVSASILHLFIRQHNISEAPESLTLSPHSPSKTR